MSVHKLSPYGLRRALLAGIRRVAAQREELNRINVFPVADRDTGTNLTFTLAAMLRSLRRPSPLGVRELLQGVAAEAADGARGNAGAILAHWLHGLANALPPGEAVTLPVLAKALGHGAAEARTAMADPCEGTMLSVIQAFTAGMQAQAESGKPDLRNGFSTALSRARIALAQTQHQLKALRAAGVVDAGARGFVELIEGMGELIEHGRVTDHAGLALEPPALGVEAFAGSSGGGAGRYLVQCTVGGDAIDRAALKAALRTLPSTRIVLAGSRTQVRLHAQLDEPAALLALAVRFGTVSAQHSEDLNESTPESAARRRQVAIASDSGADLPVEEVERLNIHLVPQRLSIAGREHIDRVSISPREFYAVMRTGPDLPRTSQPSPGDFRRMFELLLTLHERVIDVSLSRKLSGTMQSAEGAAARCDPQRVTVFDSEQVAAGQGLMVIWAAEAAQAGLDSTRLLEGLAQMRTRTSVYAIVRDISYGVRGGRIPKAALPVTRFLRLSLILCSKGGRLGLQGALWGRHNLPARFARRIARTLDPARRYRFIVSHGDCPSDAERLVRELRALVPNVDRLWVVETGVAIGAHAGPGSLVIAVQDYVPPTP
jgi:DegV family protein with EDD domain